MNVMAKLLVSSMRLLLKFLKLLDGRFALRRLLSEMMALFIILSIGSEGSNVKYELKYS